MEALALVIMLGALGAAETFVQAPIVPGATALEENGRYEAGRSFDETIEYYKRLFRHAGGARWRNIVNLPGVKAKHIESLRKRTKWKGINVYEVQGRVRIFVIPRDTIKSSQSAKAE